MGRHKAYSRDEVLKRAMDLFWRKGFEGTHLQELVQVTGLNRFSLYKEFGGKDGLFEESVNLYLAGMQDLGKILSREPLGLGNVLEYVKEVIFTDYSQGCFMVNTLTQRNVIQEKIRNRVLEFIENGEKALRKNLEASRENGELSREIDPAGLAKILLVFDIGMVTYSLANPTLEEKMRVWESYRKIILNGVIPAGGGPLLQFPLAIGEKTS